MLYRGVFLLIFSYGLAGSAQNAHSLFEGHKGRFKSGFLTVKQSAALENVTEHYYYTDWKPGTILLANGEKLEVNSINFNLTADQFELKTSTNILLANWKEVDRVEIDNEGQINQFQSPRLFFSSSEPGLIEVLYDSGKTKLVRHIQLERIPSNYNQALAVGSKQDKYQAQSELYLIIDGQLHKATRSKRKASRYFEFNEAELLDYLKMHDLNLAEASSWVRYLNYVHELDNSGEVISPAN